MRLLRDIKGPAASPTGKPAPRFADDEIDLGHLAFKLWRGKFWVILTTVLSLSAGIFQLANTFPTYQADALVQLEDRSGRMALPSAMQDMVETSSSAVTESEILRSRMVLGQVVAEQNLDWLVTPETAPVIGTLLRRYDLPVPSLERTRAYARRGESITLDYLQVPPHWLGVSLPVTITEAGYQIETPDGNIWNGSAGETLSLPEQEFAINLSQISAPAGREYTIRQIPLRGAIDSLSSRLSVSEAGRQSNILSIRLTGGDRAEIERVLEAITTVYVRQNIARSAAEAETGLQFIRGQLPVAEANLRTAQDALNQFREETSDRALAQDTLDRIEPTAFESQALMGQITRAESDLRVINQRIEENRTRYPEGHLIFRQLGQEKEAVETRLTEFLAQVQNLPETQREIINLTRDVELAQQIFFDLQSRAQEMQVLSASAVGSVRILDSASARSGAVAPNRNRTLALAALMGALAGIGIILILNWLRRGIQDASDLDALELPVFATINYTPHADFKHKRKGKLPILGVETPDDLVMEAFRSLRTSLHFGMLDATSKAIVFTSSAPEAGKSFTSVNLAVVAAQAGQKVALIDGDLRRGQLRRYFDLPRSQPGLAQYLAGNGTLEDVVVATPIENLIFIPSGRYPPNPSELLMRRELDELIHVLDENVDLIIIDAPPVLAVTDPIILGKAAGTTILIARHDVTTSAEVEAVKKTFETSGLRLAGSILNGFDPRKARGGYGYGYSYGYRYSYETRAE
ncbi:tyrosine-protein kinase Etk/Wzc [Roseinatronobacter thiooxidans]|uniref:Tyrosine-protein kinase Etk/Wzc n=1 Tax=Roseinatronobacter thiooxidans TaxID=121821 RepID=A0A2W7S5G7_9RHOB|nr:polysaccharide biosynthesis tyrosine autokinase [Roseinatronobacter thiooxidans]PZX45742.1 tyrosine-protein kinase Etk/Wzc [Roseinatronobacter thiooxidans]